LRGSPPTSKTGIAHALQQSGHYVVRAEDVVWTSELAVNEARRLAAARPDLTIINIPVWAFQHFTMRAASELPGPLLLFSNKQAIWANGRARVRTSLALAMQKVVGSSPIIRSQNPRKSGVFVFWEAT
jgi:L-fucose isomerase-like protein